ncbi:MAG: hypothetical protein J6W56_09155 [Prevotella sp.]|nr:hypothetical protein [Prevotella sp.]
MNYNRRKKNSSTLTIHVMCAIVFVLFSLAWLYFFQADVMAMTQYELSGGLTHYNAAVGALIITVLLYLLQLVVYAVTRLKKRSHALTYVPSMLILAMLTDVSQQIASDGDVDHTISWWLVVLIILVWGGLVFLARQFQQVEDDDSYSFVSPAMWINMLTMSLLMMGVAWLGNTNAVFHYRMQTEALLARGEYEKALMIGKKSLESDNHLMMLRMYALARTDGLGQHLFEYPVSADSSEILPTNGKVRMMLCPEDSLYRFLGARPAEKMEPERYLLMLLRRDSVPRRTIGDYLLCSYLINKDIDRFAREVGRYYVVNDSLPKHYREALTLYIHQRSNPLFVTHFTVTEEDFNNFREMEREYPTLSERKGKIGEQYRGTYWYYYKYE